MKALYARLQQEFGAVAAPAKGRPAREGSRLHALQGGVAEAAIEAGPKDDSLAFYGLRDLAACADFAAARARADSIAAAERARREAEERALAAGVARVREALSDIIYFEYDSNELTAQAQQSLQTKAAILRANAGLQVRVDGHADERGSTEYNLALSQRRAETVRDFLAGYGIAATRISTIPYGEERPRVEGTGESVWSQNRRAEFAVNDQYQTPCQSASPVCVIPGNVASSTPPGLRMRRTVRSAAGTS